ncbi:hypothetical protein APR04_003899 [Promicromonospora umidemergens]|uniref:Mce-associated membrane protein n=1 Tax=Promicromonospora umidemergens TaxID=629679 RepID=A0ABP8XIE3_9MICO|nr:hypothetical protein [Promicromonospora umidemergens]
MRVRPSTIAIVTAAVFAAAGCTSFATEPSMSTSPTTAASSTSSPSPSTSPTTEAQHAAANATELVHEYYRTTDAVATDPSDLEPLKSVATSAELLRLQNTFTQWADDGWHKTGAITVVELTTQSVSLEDPDPTIQIDVCYDVTGVDVVDRSGESQVATNRPDRTWERLWVSNPNYGDDRESGWLVADRKTLERKPCAAR